MAALPRLLSRLLIGCLIALLAPPAKAADDVDGPNDCTRAITDFGDAPEAVMAYPGVAGRFPTCSFFSAPGTHDLACAPISTPPGPTGHVVHTTPLGVPAYWLGCGPAAMPPMGVDSETDGKMNATGALVSACAAAVSVDCVEPAFGMMFGQDECHGGDDAGVSSTLTFAPCTPSVVPFEAYNCATGSRVVYLNILIDWNRDGDWNDNFQCPGACSYEWAVKNAMLTLAPGCGSYISPAFMSGPTAGEGWLRITISDAPVTDDFPWAGAVTSGGAVAPLSGGETEDYPILISEPTSCLPYTDFGDAPEELPAYPSGVIGRFPTCLVPTAPGTRDLSCPSLSTVPGPTGYVKHVSTISDPVAFHLGCASALGVPAVDSEVNGKTNLMPPSGSDSACDPTVLVDCSESMLALDFGQDECYADADAALASTVTFKSCEARSLDFTATNCKTTPVEVFLNVLVDWNEDGDWNDDFRCDTTCVREWAVKNVLVPLGPGCNALTTPAILAGPTGGRGWLRLTLTATPVSDDFPWAGSATEPSGEFVAGETEDYPVVIEPRDSCQVAYTEFGDAPEGFDAYPGVVGAFPSCLSPGPVAVQTIECGTALGPVPGAAGYVKHDVAAGVPGKYWLGCNGLASVDGEPDAKTGLVTIHGTSSACTPGLTTDCTQAFGVLFGQDECLSDLDHGFPGGVPSLGACTDTTLSLAAYLCPDASGAQVTAYLNLLVDWTHDGDWVDSDACSSITRCAPEWAVRNAPVTLSPGCNLISTPSFRVGQSPGPAWLRVTLSDAPAPADFAWNGTAGIVPGGSFTLGETEDHWLRVRPSLVGVEPGQGGGVLALGVTPNPARSATRIRWTMAQPAELDLAVFDVSGRQVRLLARGASAAGAHDVAFDFRGDDGRELPLGVYLVRLRVGEEVVSRHLTRIR